MKVDSHVCVYEVLMENLFILKDIYDYSTCRPARFIYIFFYIFFFYIHYFNYDFSHFLRRHSGYYRNTQKSQYSSIFLLAIDSYARENSCNLMELKKKP